MYYIMNQTNQVIAADDSLLEILHVKHIDELTREIILGNIHFSSLTQEKLDLITPNDTFTYTTHTSILSSLLGTLQLVHLLPVIDKEDIESLTFDISDDKSISLVEQKTNNDHTSVSPMIENNNLISIDIKNDDVDIIEKVESPIVDNEEIISVKDTISIQNEEMEIIDRTEDITFLDNVQQEELDIASDEKEIISEELFDLTIPKLPEETIDEISLENTQQVKSEPLTIETNTPTLDDTTPIIIYVDEVSKNIGISDDDYNTFLNEYIDTAISLEEDLQSVDQKTRTTAMGTLIQLADVLELPFVNDIISQLNVQSSEQSKETINSFYSTLSRLTTETKSVATMETFAPKTPSIETVEDNEPNIKIDDKKEGFGTINLDDIKPIHFDFQLEAAANDLSLPVELIEEFVHDFIEQAHSETIKMLDAYKKGDLDTIQKIGHLLKGASSNLRINALSDTLYQIQFCEDSTLLEDYIKQYWGHFLSFEQQIDVLSK